MRALLALSLALASVLLAAAAESTMRDPLSYPNMLSAPLGYNPMQSGSMRQGRIPKRYIVRMKKTGKDIDSAIISLLSKTKVSIAAQSAGNSSVSTASLAAKGAKLSNRYNSKHMTGFVLELPDGVDEEDAIAKLNAHDEVVKVVPDTWVGIAGAAARMPHSAEATPNLVRIGAVVGVKSNMRASRALVQSASTQDIVVGLIDTGCDVTNKNLNIVGGMDFTSDDSYGLDGNGHGTHVAGILGSRGNNKGIIGMYPNVQLFCLKVLGASGQGTMGTVVTALNWVVENGRDNNIRVVNLSLSGEPNDEVCEAISAVVKQGITVVAAAGNNGKAMENFAPGNCKDALVVTAMTDFDGREGGRRGFDPNSGEVDDTAASFSNYASKGRPSNMVAAPGTRILSYLPAYKCLDSASNCIRGTPNLAYLSGTSMATPIISAQVAMCYEKGLCSSETASEASKILRAAYSYNKSNRMYGYKGDPLNRPIAGKYYGYLVYGNAF